ncbi:MAG: dihydrolipoamide acetyltransferase family protein [Microthrixaceae bacterium]
MSDVTMPQLGESVTEGTITRWFKAPGDEVAEDEILLEVSTDKVDTEVPSPVAGTLQELRAEEGDTVDVGTVIAVVGDGAASGGESGGGDEAASKPEPEPAAEQQDAPAAAEPPPAEEPTSAPEPEPAPAAQAQPEPQATPQASQEAPSEQASGGTPSGSSDGALLSPLVRRLLNDANVDPSAISGTGPGGRITREDAVNHIEGRGSGGARPAAVPAAAQPAAAPAPVAAPAPAAQPAPAQRAPQPAASAAPSPAPQGAQPSSVPTPQPVSFSDGDTEVPFTNIRRRTGEHTVNSKHTSPHVISAVEVDYEGVETARSLFGADFKATEGFSLTYLPFIARAAVDAIEDFPFMNASVGDDGLIVHRDVNLSVAVDLNFEGLLAPVVRQASDKRLRAIARDINDLAGRARTKKLSPDDLSGGTFTLSNSGSFGSLFVAPIINQPQVAILSTDGVTRRPVAVTDARGHESIAIHSMGNLTMSWDHRAFDGAYAAAFLARLKEILQTRDWTAEL